MIDRDGALSYRPMTNPPRLPNRNELKAIAHRAMIQRGLQPDFSPAVLEETHAFAKAAAETDPSIRDLRSLLWASIDNDDSRDLDQLSVAEPMAHGATKILVAVADVDALVKEGSAIDGHARTNTTSVYTAAEVFPMLPEKLSTDLTSLGEGQARLAIVIEMVVAVNGMVTRFDVYRAVVLNRAKLAYHSVAAWLEGTAPAPPRLAAVSGDGCPLQGFPVGLQGIVDRDAPAVADLDGDGRVELVQATMPFYGDFIEPVPEPTAGGAQEPAAVHVIQSDGKPRWDRQLQTGASWGPVIADLNGDGWPEILQQDGDQLLGFDSSGNLFPGFPVLVHRDFVRSQSLMTTPWVVGDLNGDGRPDLLQVWSSVYAGNAYMRVFGLRANGSPLRGFPFDADGMLAASRPVLTDLDGDGVNDLVMLVSDGANGGWRLVAWDLGSLLRGWRADAAGRRGSGRSASGSAVKVRTDPADRPREVAP